MFRSATKSGGNNTGPNCVEVAHFTTASASGPNGNCVQAGVATRDSHPGCTGDTCRTPGIEPGDVVVRDSKLGADSPLLVFTPERWALLVSRTATGEQEVSGDDYLLRDPRGSGTILRFTAGEWDAFRDGCVRGEFPYADLAAVG